MSCPGKKFKLQIISNCSQHCVQQSPIILDHSVETGNDDCVNMVMNVQISIKIHLHCLLPFHVSLLQPFNLGL